jgi:predicted permease
VWLPVASHGQPGGFLNLVGRLAPGVSMAQAAAEMREIDRWRIEQYVAKDPLWRGVTLELESARAGLSPLREAFRSPLVALSAIAGTLLLLACANVAGMLLARGENRRQELAMRIALGAGRARLMRQAAAESALIALPAAALGTVAGILGAGALLQIVTSGRDLPMMHPNGLEIGLAPDARVLMFVVSVTVLTALACGLAPALAASLVRPGSSLREIGVVGTSRFRRGLSNGLVVTQVAVSALLVCAAGMFAAHLDNLRYHNVGFDRDAVLLVGLDWPPHDNQAGTWVDSYRALAARLEAHPAIQSVTLSVIAPMAAAAGSRFATVPGFVEADAVRRRLSINSVAPNYFQTFGTPLVAGRDFRFADQNGSRVAIVNAAAAAYYFGSNAGAVGKHVLFEGDAVPFEIIGVAADAKYRDLREPAPRTVYLNALPSPRAPRQMAIRTIGPTAAVAADVRHTLDEVLKTKPVVTTMAAQMDATIVPERLMGVVSGALGLLGALLAATGLYGLIAFTVARRTSEIGVRIALGATRRDIVTMVFRSALWLIAAGLAAAVPIAFASRGLAAKAVVSFSGGIAGPLLLASAAMLTVGAIAALVPARRAIAIEPVAALRRE